MKFTAVVIIKSDNKTLDNIRKNINEKSKAYLSEAMKNNISSLFDIDLLDNKAIAEKLFEINKTETGFDEEGIYEFSFVFKNALIEQCKKKIDKPLGKLNFFDYYDIFDLQMTDNLIINIDQYDRFPDTIIMPDFKLIRAPKAFMNINETSNDYQKFLDWKKDLKKALKKYSNDSFSLILDCHI
ncbi:MAG: hypothetical protein WC928_02450 [Patescibacteria group bacterium]|jgi:hypothetical protein